MKKNVIKEVGYFYLAIIISIIFAGLMIYDAYNIRNVNLKQYDRRTDRQAREYMEAARAGADLKQQLIDNIRATFNTSASVYCIVSEGDEIVFIKDEQTTTKLQDKSYSNYVGTYGKSGYVTLSDNNKYFLSTALSEDENEITLSILSRVDYVVKQGKYDLLIQHVILYSILFALGCIAIAYFQMRRRKNLASQIGSLQVEMAEDRKQIVTLADEKNNVHNNDMNNKSSGFMSRKTMESIVGLMNDKQKKTSYKVTVKTNNSDEMLKVAIMLDRVSRKGCISCLYEDNEFWVLLLNANAEDAKAFISTLKVSYNRYYQERMPELDIKQEAFS